MRNVRRRGPLGTASTEGASDVGAVDSNRMRLLCRSRLARRPVASPRALSSIDDCVRCAKSWTCEAKWALSSAGNASDCATCPSTPSARLQSSNALKSVASSRLDERLRESRSPHRDNRTRNVSSIRRVKFVATPFVHYNFPARIASEHAASSTTDSKCSRHSLHCA